MSIEPEDVLVIVVWLVGAGLIIIPRFRKKKNVFTNASNADIVNAIYSLKDTIYSLKETIYAVAIILITVMVNLLK